jgi:multidrug efflux pump subunit AcrB
MISSLNAVIGLSAFTKDLPWIRELRGFYAARLEGALNHAGLVIGTMGTVVVISLFLVTPFLGQDLFPKVDACQFRLHVSAPVGTRIEETQRVFRRLKM